MRHEYFVFLTICLFFTFACNQTQTANIVANEKEGEKSLVGKSGEISEPVEKPSKNEAVETVQPKTVMDFFALLPEKYFTLEGCEPDKDKNCKIARAEYLKNYKEVEDVKNGYFKGGCDGGQSCIEMALFKRPDNTYVIAVATFSEAWTDNYFLDYKDGVWTDISEKTIPEYGKDKLYEIPRYGTSMKVFSTRLIEKDGDFEIRDKVKNIYNLEWKDGKFSKK